MKAPSEKKSIVLDPSEKAGAVLDYVLNETEEKELKEEAKKVSVVSELAGGRLLNIPSERQRSRVLFVTQDLSVLEKDSLLQLHFLNIASEFEEVHIMLLCEFWQARRSVVRLSKNMWVYSTAARYWWLQTFTAQSIARSQLRFVEGFRPDIIVALDPFESGICGLTLAKSYKRIFQVHVLTDFFSTAFALHTPEFKRKRKLAKHVLSRAKSVRTRTMLQKEYIQKNYSKLTDVALLPQHYDVASIVKATRRETEKKLFSHYAFVILFVGPLDHDSTLFRAIDACRSVLQSKQIALVVLGEGPAKKEFQTRAQILGITNQVIFKTDIENLFDYLSSADVLLCTDTTEKSEEVVIKSAAARLPLILAETPLRTDLFVDGESAFLCQKDDTIAFFQNLHKFINAGALRTQFAHNAAIIIKERLHEDPEAFKQAYKNSIESAFSNT